MLTKPRSRGFFLPICGKIFTQVSAKQQQLIRKKANALTDLQNLAPVLASILVHR
jgi:hypothetical protein